MDYQTNIYILLISNNYLVRNLYQKFYINLFIFTNSYFTYLFLLTDYCMKIKSETFS